MAEENNLRSTTRLSFQNTGRNLNTTSGNCASPSIVKDPRTTRSSSPTSDAVDPFSLCYGINSGTWSEATRRWRLQPVPTLLPSSGRLGNCSP
ncbi:hypothetical protein AVEN_254921-1 [Araneus ventricosus]|uniref:Uncharacterized protein n=1 Tax=Araneus ventricosus TaxID=182803 RepID=A0A4Y2RB77_ARAVE|nr:hypothetical protein AVEN_254921-1 [Araneus ventricosus]